jgi:hypothetical protein
LNTFHYQVLTCIHITPELTKKGPLEKRISLLELVILFKAFGKNEVPSFECGRRIFLLECGFGDGCCEHEPRLVRIKRRPFARWRTIRLQSKGGPEWMRIMGSRGQKFECAKLREPKAQWSLKLAAARCQNVCADKLSLRKIVVIKREIWIYDFCPRLCFCSFCDEGRFKWITLGWRAEIRCLYSRF